jgi:hypothetical protein
LLLYTLFAGKAIAANVDRNHTLGPGDYLVSIQK